MDALVEVLVIDLGFDTCHAHLAGDMFEGRLVKVRKHEVTVVAGRATAVDLDILNLLKEVFEKSLQHRRLKRFQ